MKNHPDIQLAANTYLDAGISILPVDIPSKRPLLKSWKDRQEKLPDLNSIQADFSKNGRGIGLVCGSVSGNLECLDFDQQAKQFMPWKKCVDAEAPGLVERLVMQNTQSGGCHVVYRCDDPVPGNLKLSCDKSGSVLIETRGQGGYILAYPSKGYEPIAGKFSKTPTITAKERDILISAARSLNEIIPSPDAIPHGCDINVTTKVGDTPGDDFNQRGEIKSLLIEAGWQDTGQKANTGGTHWRRPGKEKGQSATLFEDRSLYVFSSNAHPFDPDKRYTPFAAYTILKHAGDYNAAAKDLAAQGFGTQNPPGTQEKPTQNTVYTQGISAELVRDYVDSIDGRFTNRDLYEDLGLKSPDDKRTARLYLRRLKERGIIETDGDRAGSWRKVDQELEPMDLVNVECETLPLKLPLDIDEWVNIMPGNIIAVAGDPNVGKTAFLMNVARDNIDRYKIRYFSSEMGPQEFVSRANKFDSFPIKHPNLKVFERSDDFSDVIRSGKGYLNIIDYLEIVDNFWLISKHMKDIHKKLDGALAVIAIQKKGLKTDDALGGMRWREKPRLAIALRAGGTVKIIKAKNWKAKRNPNGLAMPFKLADGCKFYPVVDWEYEAERTEK